MGNTDSVIAGYGTYETEIKEYSLYENSQYKFRVKYPVDWITSESYSNAVVVFISPEKDTVESSDGTGPALRENVSITYQDLGMIRVSLDKYCDTAVRELSGVLNGFELYSRNDTEWADLTSKEMIYCGTFQGSGIIKFLQLFTIKGDKVFSFTFGASISKFDKVLTIAREMANSFELLCI